MKKSFVSILTACLAAGALLMATGCSGGGSETSQTGSTGTPFSPIGQVSTVTQPSTQTSSVVSTVSQVSQSIPVVSQPSVVVSQASVSPQGSPNAALAGTYGIHYSEEAMAQLSQFTTEQQQMLLSAYMTLNADGSIVVNMGGQTVSGSWWDNNDGTITMSLNGQSFTYTCQNGMIYDPSDMSSYFQKQ